MRPTSGGVSDRVVWWTAFLGLGLLGAAFALGTPLGAQPDEPAHALKAAALYGGELTWTDREAPVVGGAGRLTGADITVEVPRAYARLVDQAVCISQPPPRDATCQPPLDEDRAVTTTDRATYVVPYPPLSYALVGWPTAWFGPSTAVPLMRLVSALTCAALVASASVASRAAGGGGGAALGVALATTPTALLFFASPNPNGIEIAAAIGVAASVLALFAAPGPPGARAVVRLTVAASLLALARPVGFAVLAFVVAVALAGAATRPRVRELAADTGLLLGLVVTALAAVAALAWFLFARPLEALVGIPIPGLELGEAARESLARLPVRLREAVGVFGWGDVAAPTWMWVGWLGLAAAAVVTALVVGRIRQRLVLVGLLVVNAVLPTVMEAPRADELGFIWQGRYSLPFAVLIPVYATWVAGRADRIPRPALRLATTAVAGFTAVALVVGHGMALSRFATGRGEPWWGYLDDPAWEPEVATAVLVLMAVAGAVGWAVATTLAALAPRRSATAGEGTAGEPVEPEPTADPVGESLHA